MKKKKRLRKRAAIALLLALSPFLLLTGCQFGDKYPFYPLEKCEDNSEILYMDGVQYVRKQEWDEHAHYREGGYQYAWTPAEGIGEQIGVCGDEDTQYAALKIYEIVGDEEHIFLYTWPAHFYFGGVESRLWMQEGVTLGTPTAEMVSSVTVVSKEEDTLAQINDPAMIAALLEAYSGDSVQVPNSEDWEYGSLIMYHKDYPFLQYEIEYRYSPELEISYCQNKNRLEWLLLPAEWFAVISEHDFPDRGE